MSFAFAVERRPFAIEPLTGIMMPDGIFEASLAQQEFACHLTNKSAARVNGLTVWIKSVSDAGIVLSQEWRSFGDIAPGASVLATWTASMVAAAPGKAKVTLAYCYWFETEITVGGSTGMGSVLVGSFVNPLEIDTTIFVTKTTYNASTRSYTCEVPEGRLTVKLKGVVGPPELAKWKKADYARKHVFIGPLLIREAELSVEPSPAYPGVHGDLPFHDPWWKVVAWVVFVVALVAAFVAALLGYGTAYIGMKGEDFIDHETGDPACYNCSVDTWGGPEALSVAGILSIVAMLALAVGLADEADPWRRGQAATAPNAGELTSRETVVMRLSYPQALVAGRPFPIAAEWEYRRRTQTRTRKHAVSETRLNTHVTQSVAFKGPATAVPATKPVAVSATFIRAGGKPYRGPELYVYALILAPNGRSTRVRFEDAADEGVYRCRFVPATVAAGWGLKADAIRGRWELYICAQDTNSAAAGMAPHEAAQHIGGYMIHTPFPISVDGSKKCPDKPDVVVSVS